MGGALIAPGGALLLLVVAVIVNVVRTRRAERAAWDDTIGRHIERTTPDEDRRYREYRAYLAANPGIEWIEFKDWDRP